MNDRDKIHPQDQEKLRETRECIEEDMALESLYVIDDIDTSLLLGDKELCTT